jgi:hypothetical protein
MYLFSLARNAEAPLIQMIAKLGQGEFEGVRILKGKPKLAQISKVLAT